MKLICRALLGLLALGFFAGPTMAACPESLPTVADAAQLGKILNDICSNTGTSGSNAAQANPGSDATKALAVQGVTGGKAVSVTLIPATSGGSTAYSANITTAGSGAGTGGVAIDASPGQLYGYAIYNANSSVCYIQLLDQTQALTNLGTTVPKISMGIPANGGANVSFPNGIPFATAITAGVTTTRAGSTACSSGLDVNLWYR